VIDAFADGIYPPADENTQIDDQELQLGAANHLNRINAFVSKRISSSTRRKRIRQSLANLYHRVSVGVHDDVSTEEAQALVLTTYTLLGEIAIMGGESVTASLSAVGSERVERGTGE